MQKAGVTNVDQLFSSNTTKRLLVDGENGKKFEGKLGKLRENIADLLMEQDRTFDYEFDDPNTARNEALNIVDKASKLYEIKQSQGDLTDLRQKESGRSGKLPTNIGQPLTAPLYQTVSSAGKNKIKYLDDSKIDLNSGLEEAKQTETSTGIPTNDLS